MNLDLNDFQTFIERAESARQSELDAIKSGKILVTAREVGIFYPPETPARIMNQKIWIRPSLEEWEAQALQTQRRLAALVSEESKPAKEESTSPFISTPIETS